MLLSSTFQASWGPVSHTYFSPTNCVKWEKEAMWQGWLDFFLFPWPWCLVSLCMAGLSHILWVTPFSVLDCGQLRAGGGEPGEALQAQRNADGDGSRLMGGQRRLEAHGRIFKCCYCQSLNKDKKTRGESERNREAARRDGYFRRFSWSLPLLHNSTFQSGHWGVFCTRVVTWPAYPPGPPWGRTFLWR